MRVVVEVRVRGVRRVRFSVRFMIRFRVRVRVSVVEVRIRVFNYQLALK